MMRGVSIGYNSHKYNKKFTTFKYILDFFVLFFSVGKKNNELKDFLTCDTF